MKNLFILSVFGLMTTACANKNEPQAHHINHTPTLKHHGTTPTTHEIATTKHEQHGKDQNGDLTTKQVQELRELKRQMKIEHQRIGRDRSISGYEKGQQKRAVSMKYQQKINELTGNKYYYSKSNSRIDELERAYENNVKALEKRTDISKDEIKLRKKNLKSTYKTEKERLKRMEH